MEPTDLVLSKLGAGREKDLDFVRSAAALQIVVETELINRLSLVDCAGPHRALIADRIRALFHS